MDRNEVLKSCDWAEGAQFHFHDDPDEHDPCYVVMPCGSALAVNHSDLAGVDVARAKFIIAACNAILSRTSVTNEEVLSVLEDLDLAEGLIAEAKGIHDPNGGGYATDHLDAADGCIARVRDLLTRLQSKRGEGGQPMCRCSEEARNNRVAARMGATFEEGRS